MGQIKKIFKRHFIMLNSQDQFYTVQTFQRSPISQTSNWSGTFFCCFLQQTDSKKSCSKKLRLPCWGCVEIFTSFIYNSMHISFSSFPFFLQIQPSFINFFHSSIILLWILKHVSNRFISSQKGRWIMLVGKHVFIITLKLDLVKE